MFTKKLKKAALATAITASLGAGSVANASVIDNPVFELLGAVVVWGGSDDGSTWQVNDFIIGDGSTGTDLIPTDVNPVVTGELTLFAPTGELISTSGIDLQDTSGDGIIDTLATIPGINEGGLVHSASATQSSSFYVASNTAFSISASIISGDTDSLNNISRTMTVTEDGNADVSQTFGSAAQLPATDINAAISGNGPLSNILSSGLVFTGDRPTATAPGSIAAQSVQFTNTYSLVNQEFSAGPQTYEAVVSYTVAIP